jgi:hypothetical protein
MRRILFHSLELTAICFGLIPVANAHDKTCDKLAATGRPHLWPSVEFLEESTYYERPTPGSPKPCPSKNTGAVLATVSTPLEEV